MGFSFNLFGSSSHRRFNYRPRYYDVEAEERRKFFGSHADVPSGQENVTDHDVKAGQGTASGRTGQAAGPAETGHASGLVNSLQNSGAGKTHASGYAAGGGYSAQAGKKDSRPGSHIVGSFRPGNYQKETSHNTMVTTVIGIISLILIFVVLIYIARFYAFLIG